MLLACNWHQRANSCFAVTDYVSLQAQTLDYGQPGKSRARRSTNLLQNSIFFRRVHAYKEYLEPKPGQALKLKRELSNKHAVAVVKLNCMIAGYGLVASCIKRLYGPKKCLEHLKEMISKLQDWLLVPESWLLICVHFTYAIYYRKHFCIVNTVLEMNNVATLQNSEVSTFGTIVTMVLQLGPRQVAA